MPRKSKTTRKRGIIQSQLCLKLVNLISKHKLLAFFLFSVFTLCLISGSWRLVNQDLVFHVDIARDFLLIDDMIDSRKPSLIGPRSSIPGFFHGPLWYYINVPAFLICSGNPVCVGWSWLAYLPLYIGMIFFITQKIFNSKTAFFAGSLALPLITVSINNLFNPFGAFFLYPLVIFFQYRYQNTHKPSYLILGFFANGLIFQFQTAFAFPILLAQTILLLLELIKTKKFSHLLSPLAIIPSFITFLVFDLRHSFLQTKSVLNFITSSDNKSSVSLSGNLIKQLKLASSSWISPFINLEKTAILLTSLIFIFLLFKSVKNHHKVFRIMATHLLVFAVFMTFYPGQVWGFYTWPLANIGLLTAAGFFRSLPKPFQILAFLIPLVSTTTLFNTSVIKAEFQGQDVSSWKFQKQMAASVFKQDKVFGYFIYSPEVYAYTPRYAFKYTAKEYPQVTAQANQKLDTTYLIILPPPENRRELDGKWWTEGQVRIQKQPVETITYPNQVRVEKYRLDDQEQEVPIDPLIIDNLIFR